MITIVSGTNRNNSLTHKISLLYQQLLESLACESILLDLKQLPKDFVFSALYEHTGNNEAFNPFRDQMNTARKYVFIVPEYNNSFPGVLKAFIDAMDYPDTFLNKKCALVGLSAGIQGAGIALSHLTDIFHYCGMHVLAQKPKLAQIHKHLDEHGQLTNEQYLDLLRKQAQALIDF